MSSTKQILFIDGPPFPTGTPHLGHITTGYMKDMMIRHYMSQPNTNVVSYYGWDCHGQSIENEVDKIFSVNLTEVQKKNECKNRVLQHIANWKKVYNMMGRYLDKSEEFFTMTDDYKNVVWKIFNELWNRGFIYQDKKIMLYSFATQTPVSHIDAVQSQKDVDIVNLLAGFKLVKQIDDKDVYLIVNTSNIYHLAYNQGLGVNNKCKYWLINFNNVRYICQESYFSHLTSNQIYFTKVREININELIGEEYVSPCPNINSKNGYLPIREINFWNIGSWEDTGFHLLVHTQSEDEYNLLENKDIPYNNRGFYDHERIMNLYPNVFNRYVLEIEPIIMGILQKNRDSQIIYMMKKRDNISVCLKTDHRLFYYPVPSWFVRVVDSRDKIKSLLDNISFVPENKQNLEKWIDESKDWCISRNRIWGCPIPIYKAKDGSFKCFDTILSSKQMVENDVVERIPFVFDSWFESSVVPYYLMTRYGSMEFDKKIVVENAEQNRGWFYTQLVVAGLLDLPSPMTHIVSHGTVLSESGYRMCKMKNNLPSIYNLFNQYGSDYLRILLTNSAQPRDAFKFREARMLPQYRNSLMFQKNSLIYLRQNLDVICAKTGEAFKLMSVDEIFDVKRDYLSFWIIQELFDFQMKMITQIESGNLHNVWDTIEEIQDNVSKWYIKLKKPAFKDVDGNAKVCVSVLFWCLYYYCRFCQTVMPLQINEFYKNLCSLNIADLDKISGDLLRYNYTKNWRDDVKNLKQIITMAKIIRHQNKHKNIHMFHTDPNQTVKMPIHKLILIHSDAKVMKALQDLREYIYQEVNAIHIEYLLQESKYVDTQLRLNYKMDLGEAAHLSRDIYRKASNINPDIVSKILRNKESVKIHFPEKMVELPLSYFMLKRSKKENLTNYDFITHRNLSILIDKEINEEMIFIYEAKLLVRKIQNLRRLGGLVPSDRIKIFYSVKTENDKLNYILENQMKYIYPTLQVKLEPYTKEAKPFIEDTLDACDTQINIGIEKVLDDGINDDGEEIEVEFEEDDEVML